MIRPAWMATVILVAAGSALAQGGGTPSATQGTQPPGVLGPTGTMYDGNNARLQLPPEPNAWYENSWAGYQPSQASANAGAASATGAGAGAAGASPGTSKTGGEH